MQGAHHAALPQNVERAAYRHLGDTVMLGQFGLARQPSANRKLTLPDPVGKVVSKLHVDELGSIPIWHMITIDNP